MDLEEVQAFKDTFKTTSCTLRLISTRVCYLSLALVVLEQRHEGEVYIRGGKLKYV